MSLNPPILLLATLLAATACKSKTTSDPSDAGPKPVAAAELNLDFNGAADVKATDKMRGPLLG
jgi:hypothetical protein